MDQLHKRFTDEQVKVLFQGYCQGLLRRDTVQEILRIGKSQFFVLIKRYRQDPKSFSVSYKRATPPAGRFAAAVLQTLSCEAGMRCAPTPDQHANARRGVGPQERQSAHPRQAGQSDTLSPPTLPIAPGHRRFAGLRCNSLLFPS